ncbi:MAG: hypothetical protein GX874_03605 [Smithella sp.]|nr:hypothetical protein [Smithella sp.]
MSSLFDPAFFIFMVMAIVILSASIYKMHTLKKGAAAVYPAIASAGCRLIRQVPASSKI